MKVKDIMSKNVEIITPDATLCEVAKRMQQRGCGSVLVSVNERLVGVITDRDIALRCVAESYKPAQTKAEQIMTKKIMYCYETDEIEEVANNMMRAEIRRLPVLNNDKRLVGIVSLGDLAAHGKEDLFMICGKALGHICAAPEQNIENDDRKIRHA